MKILIEGEISDRKLVEIGKLLVKLYRGKKEHINVLFLEGDNLKTKEELTKIFKEIFK